MRSLPLLLAIALAAPLAAQSRAMASVIPALAFGPACSSTLQLENLSDRNVTLLIEGHRESGALVALAGFSGATVHLEPHQQGHYKLDIADDTTAAWAKVIEQIPSPDLSPAVAISAAAECTVANQLRTVPRGVAYPTRNPWFDGDVSDLHGNVVSLINTSESAVRASACYSSGGLYSTNGKQLQPICNASVDVQIPPFGSRDFPVTREGNSHFALRTRGEAIVLEMLHPLGENLRIYAVDSSIHFGEEAPGKP